MKVEVRGLLLADELETFVKLLSNLYLELGEESDSVEYINPEFCRTLIHTKKVKVFVALNAEHIVGFLTLSSGNSFYAGGEYGLLDEMYVVPEYRSSGAGKSLLDKAIEYGRSNGWARIDVTSPTEERWSRTRAFYTSNGFTFTGSKYKFLF